MASILLATAGSAAGGAIAGPIGALAGRFIGSSLGSSIDDKIFGPRRLPDAVGPRLNELGMQASTYGRAIPIVFGNMRLAGNVVWSRPIKETVNTKTASGGGKGGGGKIVQKQTTYIYSITMAIAICEGEIQDIVRVWADAAVINPTQGVYRVYRGTETQGVDPYIESIEGIGKAPAYRGLAYVVIEDFPLAAYGNRIPNFTFEIKRKVGDGNPVEDKVTGVVMIPASGEFAYDTVVQAKSGGEIVGAQFVQNGTQVIINQNNRSGKADAIVSLDQLAGDLPNVEWVSVVAGWFGDNLDAGVCVLKPGVEYATGGTTAPATWSVGSFSRATAHLITQVDNAPIYGGTPDDASLVRYVTELRARGYKILFYPFIFMDTTGKPWRGRITGSTTDVANFFTKTNGYNAFVTHYASLLVGKIDAFSIGSEMVGLTKVKDVSNNFPGVSALVSLAASVKTTLGAGVKVTYAADWSEYHHTNGGWYNLDPLWASSNIDVVGIDAYFPLQDGPQNGYDKQGIIDGWTGGENYDWYYSDAGRTTKVNLTPQYAIKNISWWWNNYHVNPGGATTAWVPNSKKIWFTEFGFPSVDGCANQPNVFYDPNSSESAFPRFSKGRVDFRAQRTAIEGSIDKWTGSSMVEQMFLWTWDARPYPFYPDLRSVWSDGNLWLYGHWVTGKLGLSSLAAIIRELCERTGLSADKLDLSLISELVDGFVINTISPARAGLEQLQKGFFFDCVESDGVLKFIPRGGVSGVTVDYGKLVPVQENLLNVKRAQELDLPQMIDVNYIDRAKDYMSGDQNSQRAVTSAQGKETQSLSIVFNEWEAKRIADISLYNIWQARNSYEFALPPEFIQVEPADIITINGHAIRVTDSMIGLNGEVRCKGVADDASIYDFYAQPNNEGGNQQTVDDNSATRLEIIDAPAFPSDNAATAYIRFAAVGLNEQWPGVAIYRSDDGGANYNQVAEILQPAVIGNVLNILPNANAELVDNASALQVSLIYGELESVSGLALLNGANAAIVGNEIIQFTNAQLVSDHKYILTGLLRGRLGTECKTAGHAAGERFVLLDAAVDKEQMAPQLIGLNRKYKAVTLGSSLGSAAAIDFIYTARSLKPLSPSHIVGVRDGGGNISISWIRRTRVGGELRDGADVPLSEEFEKYEIDIFNGIIVVRTLALTTAAASYSSAQQVTDFGSNQSALSIRVYQLSAIVGRGIAASAVV